MYSVRILRQAIKDIADFPTGQARLIAEHIDRLKEDARPLGSKKLKGKTDYSLRAGTYRILYGIDDNSHIVTVYRVKHRREAYR